VDGSDPFYGKCSKFTQVNSAISESTPKYNHGTFLHTHCPARIDNEVLADFFVPRLSSL
jgi:hypothetical protein